MTTVATGSSAAAMFRAGRPAELACGVAQRQMPEGVQAARRAVEQFVGETFYGLVMKEMSKSVSNDHLLSGGAGEATLRPYLNQVLAERLARSRRFELSEAMFETIYRDTPYSPVISADRVSPRMAKKEQP